MIRGSCFCRGVRFELTPPTEFVSHCHCADCRRSHGAAFVTWTAVPTERFTLLEGSELLGDYHSSSEVAWRFCTRCGSSMLYQSSRTPDKIYLTAASLEDPLDQLPDSHVSYEERVSWLHGIDKLPRYRGKTSEEMEA